MSHVIDCSVSQDELFNELGCGGGATLFIDNIDQIDDVSEWATLTDLLSGVAKSPGWRAVVTGGLGNAEWTTKLPDELRKDDIVALQVGEITDDETVTLSEQNQALAIILRNDQPARWIARNLFYLSRMVELGAAQGEPGAAIATEMDLARLWWRYGGGRSEDDGRLARLKVCARWAHSFSGIPAASHSKLMISDRRRSRSCCASIACGKRSRERPSHFGTTCCVIGRSAFCSMRIAIC